METAARVAVKGLQKLSLPSLRRLGRLLGTGVYHLARSRRKVALDNLDLAYGEELSAAEKKQIARASFVNLVTTGLEFCASPGFDRPMMELMRVLNPNVFRKAYEESRGMILLVPHMGNWEVSARWFAEQGYVTHAVVRKQKQPWITRIVSEIRRSNGIREIDKKNALPAVLRAVRNKEIVFMLIDQYARKDAVPVTFFGKPAMTVGSTALIAQKTGCTVMVACCFRFPDGSFGGVFSEPLETRVSGNKEEDLIANTQTYVAAIESFVRRYPQDWMWMHRRWK